MLWICDFDGSPLSADDRAYKDNMYQYKINRSMFVATMKDKLIETLSCPYDKET